MRVCAIAAGVIVLLVTWRTTSCVKVAAREVNVQVSLTKLLLRGSENRILYCSL